MNRGAVVVIGLARTGRAVARTFAAEGRAVRVIDRDDNAELRERAAELPPGVTVTLGGYDSTSLDGASLVVPSPGVPWDAPELAEARRRGIDVRSEVALVFERCRGRIVGITGTNGKTTTTSLVAAVLSRGDVPVHCGGNIGVPMIDRLEAIGGDDWVVLELSSFQLESVEQPRCAVGCVLNVTPDHLDRHGSLENYAAIKERVVRFARDCAVLGWDDPVTRDMASRVAAPLRWFGDAPDGDRAVTRDGVVVSVERGREVAVLPVSDIPLFGPHNVGNVLAAVSVTRACGMDAASIADGVRDFSAVPHRLQTVAVHRGVLWINDSKATNTESTLMALRSFEGRPIVWIGGGRGMGTPLDTLAAEVAHRVRHALLIGEIAAELDGALAARGFTDSHVSGTLERAVDDAASLAETGDVVLFAPGFKSFDQFRSFEHRGDEFMRLVRARTAAEDS
ncbi:MAG: UDP-N-acetylmuramoyl-L-alanine--D-glutamate ligase [Candidatus Dormibacteraeota bacterium]|nr:UDP-N-acetylmuramoyl-L-alanine--D-glutamate ligase [Candidatus Dormibacteraeota bacterium]